MKTRLMRLINHLLLILLGIFLAHLLLEIGLSAAGKIILWQQELRNLAHAQTGKNNAYKILCIGESTTMLGGEDAYPRQLERLLRARYPQRNFQVINEGVAGVDTDYILAHVRQYLDTYRPQMVIAMMGINDSGSVAYKTTHEAGFLSAVRESKTYKVYQFIFRGIKNWHQSKYGNGAAHSNDAENPDSELKQRKKDLTNSLFVAASLAMIQKKYGVAEQLFKMMFKGRDQKQLRVLYRNLAVCYFYQGKWDDYIDVFDHINYSSWGDLQFVELCQNPPLAAKIKSFLRAKIAKYPNESVYADYLAECMSLSNEPTMVDSLKKQADEIREKSTNLKTRRNYLALAEILHERHVKTVFVQYPMRNAALLKRMLKDAKDNSRILFVDNEQIFKEAVKQSNFFDYFSDRFAGDFGHCTPKGNYLLASHILEAIKNSLETGGI